MAFALFVKQIKCPNCNYEGKASVQGSGCGLWLLFLVLFFVSFLIWPLFIVAAIMFLWLIFKQAKQICPNCKFENPIPQTNKN
jgi:hypothetical protein